MRPGQSKIINAVQNCIANKKKLMIHAPTGLGKTAAVIYAALDSCQKTNNRILFLTSKHTHQVVVYDTMRRINARSGDNIRFGGINGKRSMCLFENNVEPQLFMEFCRSVREQGICDFYSNTFSKDKEIKHNAINTLSEDLSDPESIMNASRKNIVCPYEISLLHAKRSRLVVANYSHIFDNDISSNFLSKSDIVPKDTVLVVDEAHNLPNKMLDINSFSISLRTLERSKREISEYGEAELALRLGRLMDSVSDVKIEKEIDIARFFEHNDLDILGKIIKKNEDGYNIPASFSLHKFVGHALSLDDDNIEYATNEDGHIKLNISNLDSSASARQSMEVFGSSILISGTFKPMDMFANLLGIPDAEKLQVEEQFSRDNRLFLTETDLTSKFTMREKQYPLIAERCDEILSDFKYNSIFFFPSYSFMGAIYRLIKNKDNVILEQQKMTRDQKLIVMNRLSSGGASLFAVINGNFSESIGIKNNSVKLIAIIGLPLEPPSIRLKALQGFYQSKFDGGFEYAQVLPSMIKVMQAAGRAVRSEKDKAVLLLVDARFEGEMFKKYLPDDIITINGSPMNAIRSFGLI